MRDPKTHSKVLALRRRNIYNDWRVSGSPRWSLRKDRLWRLVLRLNRAASHHEQATGWYYNLRTRAWRHTTIIPDTEEDTP